MMTALHSDFSPFNRVADEMNYDDSDSDDDDEILSGLFGHLPPGHVHLAQHAALQRAHVCGQRGRLHAPI
jgi:hypothetical protein